MEKFLKDGTKVNIALENELSAKSYSSSYTASGDTIDFQAVRQYFHERGGNCTYYLLFATTGATNIWYGIVDWRADYYGVSTPKLIPLYNGTSVQPGTTTNIGTVKFGYDYTYYQVTPVGI